MSGIKQSQAVKMLVAGAFMTITPPCFAQEHSFAGKTVNVNVGFEAGNRVDMYARMLGKYMSHHLTGQPNFIFLNRPGAGGVISLNDWMAKSEPTGLHIAIGGQTQIDQESLSRMQARYQPAKFRYAGGLGAPSQGLFVEKSAMPRLTDKSKPPVSMGVVGSSLRSGYYQVLWGAAFLGWNVKWVSGYHSTGEVRNALERGEIDMTAFGSSHDIEYLQKIGDFVVASQSGAIIAGKSIPRSAFGSAPIISDLLKGKITDPIAQQAFEYGEQVVQAGMWVALPPSTPDATVNAYIQAYDKAIAEPQYQAEWVRIDPDSPNASRDDLEAMIRKLGAVSDEALGFIRDELRRQGMEVAK